MNRTHLTTSLVAMLSLLPSVASAQTHELYFHHAGALLAYADAQVRILYAAVTAKEFDKEAAKKTLEELDRTLAAGKTAVDRIQALLPENLSNLEQDLVKFRGEIKAAEDQLRKLGNDIEEQTKGSGEDAEEGGGVKADWDLLKKGCGWLAADVQGAKSSYAKLAVRLKVKPAGAVPKPKGSRG